MASENTTIDRKVWRNEAFIRAIRDFSEQQTLQRKFMIINTIMLNFHYFTYLKQSNEKRLMLLYVARKIDYLASHRSTKAIPRVADGTC